MRNYIQASPVRELVAPVTLPLKLLLVDDHALFREGVESILSVRMPEVELRCAAHAAQAEACLECGLCDWVLLDIDLGVDNGLQLLARWRRRWPDLPIVMLSASPEPGHMAQALKLGARGFIPKTCSGALLVGALELVRAGGTYVPPELIAGAQVPAPQDDVAATDEADRQGLTPRQLEVLTLLAQGCSNKDIARRLAMADGTVRTHINALFRALEVSNRTQAVLRAQELGCLPEENPRTR